LFDPEFQCNALGFMVSSLILPPVTALDIRVNSISPSLIKYFYLLGYDIAFGINWNRTSFGSTMMPSNASK